MITREKHAAGVGLALTVGLVIGLMLGLGLAALLAAPLPVPVPRLPSIEWRNHVVEPQYQTPVEPAGRRKA